MSDAFDITSAMGSGPLGGIGQAAGQVASEALQGPLVEGALHDALSGMGDVIQHLADGALSHAAENAGELAGHAAEAAGAEAAGGDALHVGEWDVMRAEVTHVGETLDAVEDHAMQLMASPNAADQLEGQQLMQQVQHQTEAILEVLQGQSELLQSTINNLHGDSGVEAVPVEMAMVDHVDGAWDHDAGAHVAGADHADTHDGATADGGGHHDDGAHAVATEPAAHDATTDPGDHTA